jgi:rhodanese-related sulfurtransferase
MSLPPAAPSRHLTRDEVRARLRAGGAILVDVRARAGFDEGHLPDAISLPVAEIPERASEILPDPSQEIIVYCGSST